MASVDTVWKERTQNILGAGRGLKEGEEGKTPKRIKKQTLLKGGKIPLCQERGEK